MKKLLRYSKLLQVMVVALLIACMVLPTTIAYAETPLTVTAVAASAASDGLGSPFQHHSFTDNGTSWVFYQADLVGQVVGSYTDDGTTWVALPAIAWCNTSTMTANETKGGQFDTWWNASTHRLSFAVVNTSVNGSTIQYRAFTVNSVAHTLTPVAGWITAVAGVANVSYRNPTICENNAGYPFITYGYVKNASSDVYVTTTNSTVTWLAEVGFPMHNLSATGRKCEYGSVIPLYTSMTNVSVQYADYNGSVYKISQCNLTYNGTGWKKDTVYSIDTSGWFLPSNAEWNYNAVSVPLAYGLNMNYNDVVIQCIQTSGATYRVFTNRRANESDAWGSSGAYARNFGAGGWAYDYVGAMGIRNAIYGLVYSSWDMSGGSTKVYSNDFNATTGNWSGIAQVYTDSKITYVSTMSDYKASTTGYLGFMYGTITDDTLMYVRYGPVVPPTPSDAGTNLLQLILALAVGLLVLIIILKQMQDASTGSTMIAIGLSAIVGAVAFIVVKLVVGAL